MMLVPSIPVKNRKSWLVTDWALLPPLSAFVNVVTGTDCWTQNFSTHGRLFVCWISQCRFFLTRSLPWRHLKTTNKSEKSETCKPFCFFFALACERIFIKTRDIEIRCAIGPENILFADENVLFADENILFADENILFADASVHLSARTFYRLG